MIEKKNRDVYIFHPHSDIFCNATMLLVMQKHINLGDKVFLFTYEKPEHLDWLGDQISFEILPRFHPRVARRPITFLKKTLLPLLKCWTMFFFTKSEKKIIVVDDDGLLIANKALPGQLKSFNYISFEVFSLHEIDNQLFRSLKEKTILLFKKGLKSLLIQDQWREKLFFDENPGSNFKSVFYLPIVNEQHQIDHPIFYPVPVPNGKKSIVYSGSILPWSGIVEILEQLKTNWNSNFYLVVHYRFPEIKNEIVEEIRKLAIEGYPITLVDQKIPYADYYHFLKQFDSAFATYIPHSPSQRGMDGKNFEIIGLASGKFNAQMMLGLPTITTNQETFVSLKSNYNFGYVLNSFNDIKNALNEIDGKLPEMRKEAKRLFDELLDPHIFIDQYIAS